MAPCPRHSLGAGDPGRPPGRDVTRGARRDPPPLAPGRSDCGAAFRDSSTPASPRAPPQPSSRLRDGTGSSPPTPAARATTAATLPPLAVRVGHGAAEAPPPGAPQTKPEQRQHMDGRKWRRGRGLLPSSPSQRAPLPLGIHFPEKPVSPRAARSQPTPQCHGASLPDPGRYLPVGLRRRNPVRGDRVAENACSLLPMSGASGAVVKWRPKLTPLAANPIQFHSPPSALPVRARPRVTPPSLPSRARPLLSLPQPLPYSSSSFSPYHLHQPPSAFFPGLLFLVPAPPPPAVPVLSAAAQARVAAFPLLACTLARSLPRSLGPVP